jgi:hypothetical protein
MARSHCRQNSVHHISLVVFRLVFRLSSADSHIFPGQFSSDEPFFTVQSFPIFTMGIGFGIGEFYLVSACRISHIWQRKKIVVPVWQKKG